MPINVLVRPLRTKWRFTDFWPEVEKEILHQLVNRVRPEVKGQLDAVVANWKNKPEFRVVFTRTRDDIGMGFYATGPSRMIWQYVNEGTRPHKIPKSPKPIGDPLKFRLGYVPRTGTGGRFGGPGRATGGWRSAHQVDHPGTEARNFTGVIQEKYRTTYSRHIKRAMDRATKRIIRRAK